MTPNRHATANGQATERDAVTAIVLAGGRAARFGGPKLDASIEGRTVLDRALLAVDQVAGDIVLAGPQPASLPALVASIRAVPDDEPFAGPLAALAGALRAVDPASELAIVVGGDMPALVPGVLRRMLDRLRSDADVDAATLEPLARATPRAGAKTPMLPLALRIAPAVEAARAAIEAEDRSLVRLLGRLRAVMIPAGEWRAVDPEGNSLLDVDVPADLDRLRGNEIR